MDDEASVQTPGARTITEKFAVQGNSLDEIQDQVRQHVNEMGLTNGQEAEVTNGIIDDIRDQLPDPDGTGGAIIIFFIILIIIVVLCVIDANVDIPNLSCG
jgi:hypothetical protein